MNNCLRSPIAVDMNTNISSCPWDSLDEWGFLSVRSNYFDKYFVAPPFSRCVAGPFHMILRGTIEMHCFLHLPTPSRIDGEKKPSNSQLPIWLFMKAVRPIEAFSSSSSSGRHCALQYFKVVGHMRKISLWRITNRLHRQPKLVSILLLTHNQRPEKPERKGTKHLPNQQSYCRWWIHHLSKLQSVMFDWRLSSQTHELAVSSLSCPWFTIHLLLCVDL